MTSEEWDIICDFLFQTGIDPFPKDESFKFKWTPYFLKHYPSMREYSEQFQSIRTVFNAEDAAEMQRIREYDERMERLARWSKSILG